jgi:hypothetical protein
MAAGDPDETAAREAALVLGNVKVAASTVCAHGPRNSSKT